MDESYTYNNSVYNSRMDAVMYILFCNPEMSFSEAVDELEHSEGVLNGAYETAGQN